MGCHQSKTHQKYKLKNIVSKDLKQENCDGVQTTYASPPTYLHNLNKQFNFDSPNIEDGFQLEIEPQSPKSPIYSKNSENIQPNFKEGIDQQDNFLYIRKQQQQQQQQQLYLGESQNQLSIFNKLHNKQKYQQQQQQQQQYINKELLEQKEILELRLQINQKIILQAVKDSTLLQKRKNQLKRIQ